MDSYDKAFKLFEEVFKQVTEKVESDAHEQHIKALAKRRKEEENEHAQEISAAESELDSTPSA